MGWGRVVVLISLLLVVGFFIVNVNASDDIILDSGDSDSISNEGGDSELDSSSSTQPIEDSSSEESPSTDLNSVDSGDEIPDDPIDLEGDLESEIIDEEKSDEVENISEDLNESVVVVEEKVVEDENSSDNESVILENDSILSGDSLGEKSLDFVDEKNVAVLVELKSSKIVVGEQVRWIKKVAVDSNSSKKSTRVKVDLPAYANNVSVKKNADARSADLEIDNSYNENRGKSRRGITGNFFVEVKKRTNILEDVFVYLKRFALTGYFIDEANEEIVFSDEAIEVYFDEDGLSDFVVVEFFTPAPLSVEFGSANDKTIRVFTDEEYYYENILAYTTLEVEAMPTEISLFEVETGRSVSFEYFDLNNNGLVDYIEWTVPHLSEMNYELSITVLNPVEYLKDGDVWTVYSQTRGVGDLKIKSTNSYFEEIWEDNLSTVDEMKFLDIGCGDVSYNESLLVVTKSGTVYNYNALPNNIKPYEFVLENYSCEDVTYFSSYMNIAGYAILNLSFSNDSYLISDLAIDPILENEVVLSSSSGNNLFDDNLSVGFTLSGSDVLNSTVVDWRINGSSIAALNMPFNVDYGSVVKDYSTNGYNGTLVNSPTYMLNGRVGGAYDFGGNGEYINLGNVPELDISGKGKNLTACLWVNAQGVNDQSGGLFDFILGKGWMQWQLGFYKWESAYYYGFSVGVGESEDDYYYVETISVGLDEWHHICARLSLVNNENYIEIFHNGALTGSYYSQSFPENIYTSTSNVTLGCADYEGTIDQDYCFIGYVDEVLVVDEVLSNEQIYEIYQAGVNEIPLQKIVSQETEVGDVWSAVVIPGSGNSEGVSVLSNSLNILASLPDNGSANVLFETFSGNTTDFSTYTYEELESLSNVVLEKPSLGKIAWSNSVNVSAADFDSYVQMGSNWISVDSENLDSSLNSSAEISFYSSKTNPIIFRDGVVCGTCEFISNSAGIVTYLVNGFSNYTIYDAEFSRRISDGNDDAEEYYSLLEGTMDLDSLNLKVSFDSDMQQYVALRFINVTIPNGANVTATYVEFEIDEINYTAGSVNITGEAIDDSPVFSSVDYNISNRVNTNSTVGWTLPSSGSVDDKHHTVDISEIIQEVVDREGWESGNALTIIFHPSDAVRIYESYEGESANAPLLVVNYSYEMIPSVGNVTLTSLSGNNLTSDNLSVSYDLADGATSNSSVVDWRKNGSSFAVLNMPFNIDYESVVKDYSTNEYNGTLVNSTSWITNGKVGGAYNFSGSGDYINLGDVPELNVSGKGKNLTACVWVNAQGVNDQSGGLFDFILGRGWLEWQLGFYKWGSDYYYTFSIATGLGVDDYYYVETISVGLDEWHHVCGRLSLVNDENYIEIFHNGALTGPYYSESFPENIYTLTANVTLGCADDQGTIDQDYCFIGYVDEVLVVDEVLSNEQINAIYQAGVNSRPLQTIVSQETEIGDVWSAMVTPSNGGSEGIGVLSNNLTIIYSASNPSVSNIILNSSSGNNLTTDNLSLSYVLDDGAIENSSVVDWRKNGSSFAALNMPFNVNYGSVAKDYTTYELNGSVSGATWSSNGKVGGAYSFGGSHFINLGQPSSLNFHPYYDEFALEAWVKVSPGIDGTIISKADATVESRQYQLYIHSSTADKLSANIGGQRSSTGVAIDDGEWHHVVLRLYNESGVPTGRFYLDGVELNTSVVRGSSTNSYDVLIGARRASGNTGSGFQLNGMIDDVKIWNGPLTYQQIVESYESGINNRSLNKIVDLTTNVEDVWSAMVIPSDGNIEGVSVLSNNVTIVDLELPISFNSTWNTSLTSTGSSNATQVTLPLVESGNYDFRVDWGDGTSDMITSWNQSEVTHNYVTSGVYNISIYGDIEGWQFNNAGDKLKLIEITEWGPLRLGNANGYFYGATNLQITATDVLDLTGMTSLDNAFRDCSSLTTVPNMDQWNVSGINRMSRTFQSASNFNQDLNSWDVSNVTTMNNLFSNAVNFNGNISLWNPSKVTDMTRLFFYATDFNQYIGDWDVSSTTNMAGTFFGATNFNQDISSWNTSKLQSMWGVFINAVNFDQDIGSWNTSSVTRMDELFIGAVNFNQNLSAWDTSKVTIMNNMFQGATSFDQDISSWNVSAVTTMSNMFANGAGLSTEHYDALLVGWNNLELYDNIIFDAGTSTYCMSADARANIISVHNWTINDGGTNCPPVNLSFVSPTPQDDAIIFAPTQPIINVSLNTTYLNNFTFNWNGINATYYDDSLVLMLNLNNVSSFGENDSFVYDSSLYENHGTVYGASLVDGKYQSALNFESNADYVSISHSDSLNFTDEFSIGVWVYPYSNRNYAMISAKGSFDGGFHHYFITESGRLRLSFPRWDSIDKGTSVLDIGEWSYVVAVYNGTHVNYYLNGEADGSIATAEVPAVTSANLLIGLDGVWDYDYWSGIIDEFKIWNRVLSSEEINEQYKGNFYKFDSDSWNFEYHSDVTLGNYSYYAYANEDVYNQENQTEVRNFEIVSPTNVSGFNTVWNTSLISAGSSNATQVTLPLVESGTYNFIVDWGDGTQDIITSWNQAEVTHTYATEGVYNINISGTIEGWRFTDDVWTNKGDVLKLLEITQWGDLRLGNTGNYFARAQNLQVTATDILDLTGTTTLSSMFRGCSNLTTVPNMDQWDVSAITSMNSMFAYATNFNQDIGVWNTTNVIDLSYMFWVASSFNQSINSWNTSNVTTMHRLFASASSFDQDLDLWDTRNVINMERVFHGASNFNGNISTWNTSKVTTFFLMFSGATSFDQDISSWDVSTANNMNSIFSGATSFDQDISSWNVSSVTTMVSMFAGGAGLSTEYYDALLIGWNDLELYDNVTFDAGTSTYCMSADARANIISIDNWTINDGGELCDSGFESVWNTSLTSAGSSNSTQIKLPLVSSGNYNFRVVWGDGTSDTITSWNQAEVTHNYATSGVYNISLSGTIEGWRFNNGGDRLKILEINQWGPLRLGNANGYFYGAENLEITATDVLDMTGTTNMFNAFRGCSSLTIVPSMNEWDMGGVTSINSMFYGATNFNQNISTWNTSGVTDLGFTFYNASSFNQQIQSWDVSGVWTATNMFENAVSFNQPLNEWNVTNLEYLSFMFKGATSFNQPLNEWNLDSAISFTSLFENAEQFNGNISTWTTGSARFMRSMFSGASSFNQDIGSWDVSSALDTALMFNDATNFNQDIGSWNTSSITNMGSMFDSAISFNQNISSWDVSKVTNFAWMFNVATNFNQDIGSWDISKAVAIDGMFNAAVNFDQDIGSWNISSVNDIRWMFSTGAKLSTENYDALLIGWNNLSVLTDELIFHAENSTYCFGADARANIISVYNWTINDGGELCEFGFESVWDTSLTSTGSSNATQITLPLVSSGNYNFKVVWGDGTSDMITSWNQAEVTHNYTTSGVYNISIYGTIEGWQFNDAGDKLKLIEITEWGPLLLGDVGSYFRGAANLEITAIDVLNITGLTTLENMFRGCSNLTTVPSMNEWDTSTVYTMTNMFYEATNFNQNISNWNTSDVGYFTYMFYRARNFNQDINSWDVSNAISLMGTFAAANSFNQSLDTWNTSKVLYMNNLFNDATVFNQDINSWDTSKVQNMAGMFAAANSFNQPLDSWNTSKVSNMGSMFNGATSFNQNINSWDVSSVDSVGYMFWSASGFNQPLNNWTFSSLTSLAYMFGGASSFNQSLNEWDVSNITSFAFTFYGLTDFNQPFDSWNTSSANSMQSMFQGATNFDQDISSWDVSGVTTMDNMFAGGAWLSVFNYDSLLVGWSSQNVQSDVLFHAGTSTYSVTGKVGRDILTNVTNNWVIADGGFVESPYIEFVSPTNENGIYAQDFISVNVSAYSDNFSIANITIYLYNSSGLILENISFGEEFFWNVAGLVPGEYYLNATVWDVERLYNSTETRVIELISNSVPVMEGVDVSPVLPSLTDDLVGSCLASDENLDNLTFYYIWYKDDSVNYSGSIFAGNVSGEYFNVNDVSNSLTSQGEHWVLSCMASDGFDNSSWMNSTDFVVMDFGDLNIELITQFGEINNQPQNEVFVVSANVTCVGNESASCGNVLSVLRYNETSLYPDSNIGNDSDVPFSIIGNSTISCSNLNFGDECLVNWTVNATGDIGEVYNLNVYANSSYVTYIEPVNSSNFSIKIISSVLSLILSDDLFNVDFGTELVPGTISKPALNNSDDAYSITCQHLGASCNVSIAGNSNLISSGNVLGVSNISWAPINNNFSGSSLDVGYTVINSSLSHGTTQNLYFWLDIPSGLVAGNYRGNFTIYGESA